MGVSSLPPESTVKSQPVVPLGAMSGSRDIQHQGSVLVALAHVTTKNMWLSPFWTDSLDMLMSKGCAEPAASLSGRSTGESWHCSLPGPAGRDAGGLTLPLICRAQGP